jgi:hypothetical protein
MRKEGRQVEEELVASELLERLLDGERESTAAVREHAARIGSKSEQ